MKITCPKCGIEGSLQIRGKSARVGHYRGYSEKTRVVEWHSITYEMVNMVNNGKQLMVNNTPNLRREAPKVAGGEGFEPSTPNLGGWCSIREDIKTIRDPPFCKDASNPY
jgi:hypothetical protein